MTPRLPLDSLQVVGWQEDTAGLGAVSPLECNLHSQLTSPCALSSAPFPAVLAGHQPYPPPLLIGVIDHRDLLPWPAKGRKGSV